MYNIEDLNNLFDVLKRHSFDRNLISEINSVLNALSGGVSIPLVKREKLYCLLQRLQYYSNGDFKISCRKVMSKIRRERRLDAECFYLAHDPDKIKHVDSIDFGQEIIKSRITPGKSLFQWCKMVINKDGEATLYNSKTLKKRTGIDDSIITEFNKISDRMFRHYCTIGNYFSGSIVSPSSLGIGPFFDIEYGNNHFAGTGQQVCCRFTFPFEVDCLISTARGAVDTWNVHHYSNGSIKSENNMGVWGNGGAVQYFLPLTNAQKVELAKIAEFI